MHAGPSQKPTDVSGILQLINARTGLQFGTSSAAVACEIIQRSMTNAGYGDPALYCARLATQEKCFADLVEQLTVGETYFFRDYAQFDFLERSAIPALCSARPPSAPLRIWSAGCASGEEPYSLAMLLTRLDLHRASHILATDLSTAALRKAEIGRYSAWSLRGEHAELALPFLDRRNDQFIVQDGIKRLVHFAALNLAAAHYPSPFSATLGLDIIFCRNVLIYLDKVTIAQVYERFFAALAPGGWLITAPSDPSPHLFANFQPEVAPSGVYFRKPYVGVEPATVPLVADAKQKLPANPLSTRAPSFAAAQVRPARTNRGADSLHRVPKTGDDLVERCQDIKRLANQDFTSAEGQTRELIQTYPTRPEPYFVLGLLLLNHGDLHNARTALKRAIFLDGSLIIAYFFLAQTLRHLQDHDGAYKALRNAQQCCNDQSGDLACGDGESVARWRIVIDQQLSLIDSQGDCACHQ